MIENYKEKYNKSICDVKNNILKLKEKKSNGNRANL